MHLFKIYLVRFVLSLERWDSLVLLSEGLRKRLDILCVFRISFLFSNLPVLTIFCIIPNLIRAVFLLDSPE